MSDMFYVRVRSPVISKRLLGEGCLAGRRSPKRGSPKRAEVGPGPGVARSSGRGTQNGSPGKEADPTGRLCNKSTNPGRAAESDGNPNRKGSVPSGEPNSQTIKTKVTSLSKYAYWATPGFYPLEPVVHRQKNLSLHLRSPLGQQPLSRSRRDPDT